VDIHEVTRSIVVHILICDFISIIQPLPGIVTSELRFDFYIFLPCRGVVQQSIINRSLAVLAHIGMILILITRLMNWSRIRAVSNVLLISVVSSF
jgi:hypothetical protein